MQKRSVLFGSYNTAAHGWTLTGYSLSDPEQKTNYVEKPGGDGSWDLSTALTDGIPRYKDRTLTVTLECSEGDRSYREDLINDMVNLLDGLEWHTVLPDRPNHYLTGRLHVAVNSNSLAYAEVTVTGVVASWFYSEKETAVTLVATAAEQTATVRNGGRLIMVPSITVTGDNADVLLLYGTDSLALSTGTYKWPTLKLTPGDHVLRYSGTGTVVITYREAVLR